jgi:hypothetical protein
LAARHRNTVDCPAKITIRMRGTTVNTNPWSGQTREQYIALNPQEIEDASAVVDTTAYQIEVSLSIAGMVIRNRKIDNPAGMMLDINIRSVFIPGS